MGTILMAVELFQMSKIINTESIINMIDNNEMYHVANYAN